MYREKMAYEASLKKKGFCLIAGIDEAGRGPLAGPVFAAACIIPPNFKIRGIDDSKKLTPQSREKIYKKLIKHPSLIYAVGIVDVEEIDRVNIYQASILAMLKAVDGLSVKPDYLLVDGIKLSHPSIPCEGIIKGDGLSLSIGAASIIAKVERDHLMCEYHEKWPEYGFNEHKGYGTEKHLAALEKYGPCPIHRRSFKPVMDLLPAMETGDLFSDNLIVV